MVSRLPVLGLFLFILVGQAMAADTGTCAAPEVMTATLKAEDQRSIVSAQLVTADRHLFGLIVTMGSDRKSGYIIKADQPLGERASQLCVYKRMANIRLFDARKPSVDPAVLLKAPGADAVRHCDEFERVEKAAKGTCLPLNTRIRNDEAQVQRVALQGLVVARAADGAYQPDGTLATMTGMSAAASTPMRPILHRASSDISIWHHCPMAQRLRTPRWSTSNTRHTRGACWSEILEIEADSN